MATVGLFLSAAASASAATPISQTFAYTGAEQTFTVPGGISELHVSLIGGEGNGGRPGVPAAVSGELSVTGGERLFVEVGGNGADGGWNGGGAGGCIPFLGNCSEDGGGASDIRTAGSSEPGSLSTRLVVAGGGGGGGGGEYCIYDCWAGSADSPAGGLLASDGRGATTTGPGAGGTDPNALMCYEVYHYEIYHEDGGDGSLGAGGAGAAEDWPTNAGASAGGGGGGYYGGGGGAACDASSGGFAVTAYGGGGSSYAGPQVTRSSIADEPLNWAGKPSITITAPVPAAVGEPTLSGGDSVGSALTEAHGLWAGSPTGYSYQWERCDPNGAIPSCVPIPGATGSSYTPASSDVGSTVRVAETAANFYGESDPSLSSNASAVVGDVPHNTAAPAINGSPVEAQTLSAARGVWSNNPLGFSYQWSRCDAVGNGCTPVSGATGLRYRLGVGDVGSTIRVQEVATDAFGTSAGAMSAAVGPVLDAPLSVQTFALVGTVRSVVPGPIASITDPGDPVAPPGGYRALIAWGDGRTSSGRVATGPAGTYLVLASHAYARQGNYALTVRVSTSVGASATSTNRVSVFAAAVCPEGAGRRGHNCLGQLSLPSGCVFRPNRLRVSILDASQIAAVHYFVDHSRRPFRGTGPTFAVALPTAHLSSGRHEVTAQLKLRSGQPGTISRTRPIAIC